MTKHLGWLAAVLLTAPLTVLAAESEPAAPGSAAAVPACGGCKPPGKGASKDAMPAMPMMKRPEAPAERPRCKQRDTNCRLNELQQDNRALEQRLDMMQKRMDDMSRRGDAPRAVAPKSGGEPAPEPHHH